MIIDQLLFFLLFKIFLIIQRGLFFVSSKILAIYSDKILNVSSCIEPKNKTKTIKEQKINLVKIVTSFTSTVGDIFPEDILENETEFRTRKHLQFDYPEIHFHL